MSAVINEGDLSKDGADDVVIYQRTDASGQIVRRIIGFPGVSKISADERLILMKLAGFTGWWPEGEPYPTVSKCIAIVAKRMKNPIKPTKNVDPFKYLTPDRMGSEGETYPTVSQCIAYVNECNNDPVEPTDSMNLIDAKGRKCHRITWFPFTDISTDERVELLALAGISNWFPACDPIPTVGECIRLIATNMHAIYFAENYMENYLFSRQGTEQKYEKHDDECGCMHVNECNNSVWVYPSSIN